MNDATQRRDPPARRLDANAHFAHLLDDGGVTVHDGGSAFWRRLAAGELPDIDRGRLITAGYSETDWSSWERHPAGDEIVMLLDGEATLVIESPDGAEYDVALAGSGSYAVVPRGCWHTLRVHAPCRTLIVTPGRGTEHRPVGSGE